MKYGIFPGCNMPALRPDVEHAIRLSMPELGAELVDLEGYVCCPAFGTFPSIDEDAKLAVNAWNLSIGEEKGVDLLVECGSCFSSLKLGHEHICHDEAKMKRVGELLEAADKKYEGTNTVKHITDALYHDVGTDRIRSVVKDKLEGVHMVVQYPCHTLYPSSEVGFEETPGKPRILADLVEALGATVDHYGCEYQCCGGAGGFHRAAHEPALEFARSKLDSIKNETEAEAIVVSCITCLMFLDRVQKDLNEADGAENYAIPVFDYNQLLALCMGFPREKVASIEVVDRSAFIDEHFG
jgi:heterodisulfide reductase subunit B